MTARLITRIFSFFLLASALFDVSCTRVTDLRPEGRGEVVVVCVLTEEATQVQKAFESSFQVPFPRKPVDLEITLLDHIVVAEDSFFSFSDDSRTVMG